MAWTTVTNIKGPKGDKGETGDQGPAGEGIAIAGSVDTYADLPDDLTTDDAGDGYLVDADGLLYIWTGTAFPADGSGVEFRGPAGADGSDGSDGAAATVTVGTVTTGTAGSSAVVSNSGTTSAAVLDFTIPQGAKGDTGSAGADGADGARGSKWFHGTGAPGTLTGQAAGDFYLDDTSGDIYELS